MKLGLKLVLGAATALAVLGLATSALATGDSRLVGTWSGYMIPTSGSHATRHHLTVVVDPGERGGSMEDQRALRGNPASAGHLLRLSPLR